MSRSLLILRAALYLACVALLLSLCAVALQVRRTVKAIEDQAAAETAKANVAAIDEKQRIDGVTDRVDGLLDAVNRPCGVKRSGELLPCGTLADLGKTLAAYRNTATLVNVAAMHEDRQLGAVDARLAKLFDESDVTVAKLDALEDAATVTVRGLRPVEQQSTALIASLQATTAQVPAIAANVKSITESGAHMMQTTDALETKAMKEYLHPSRNPLKRAWVAIRPFLLPGAEIAGQFAR